MNTYSLRAECELDVTRLQELVNAAAAGSIFSIRPCIEGFVEQMAEIRTQLAPEALREMIDRVPDGHVMQRTLEFVPLAESMLAREFTQNSRDDSRPIG